jgi:hypothetical protein
MNIQYSFACKRLSRTKFVPKLGFFVRPPAKELQAGADTSLRPRDYIVTTSYHDECSVSSMDTVRGMKFILARKACAEHFSIPSALLESIANL